MRCMKIFFSKYMYCNKCNVVFHSGDDGGGVFNYQTPSEYHHLSYIFFMLLYK